MKTAGLNGVFNTPHWTRSYYYWDHNKVGRHPRRQKSRPVWRGRPKGKDCSFEHLQRVLFTNSKFHIIIVLENKLGELIISFVLIRELFVSSPSMNAKRLNKRKRVSTEFETWGNKWVERWSNCTGFSEETFVSDAHLLCFDQICSVSSEVRLDGWCEGGLSQQRNDGGGCATMRERSERVESPGTYVTEWVSRCHFCLALCSFGQPSRALVVITWRGEGCRYMMRLG